LKRGELKNAMDEERGSIVGCVKNKT